jgi:hypothetical protein
MARPLYYGMLMFKEAGRSAVLVPVRLYGGRLKYGGLRWGCRWHAEGMPINKDLKRSARVGIEAGRDFQSASLLRLTAPSAETRNDVTLGGSAVDGFGHWSPQPLRSFPWRRDPFVDVPAASAVIVQLS